ncbi:MAG: DNA (cytosine-5-)-methyltransferase [Oscillospiraceae bacterium]
MRDIRYFDYCSGIGAFRSAFDIVGGFKCVAWCECDKTAQTAYKALYNTENEVFFEDARTINPEDIPPFDLLVGGIPCQSWSQAGKRKHFDDERGQLFFDFARILEKRHPPMFIIENVPAIITADSCNAYYTILCKIHELGYFASWQSVDGSAYLPQKRKRLFLVGVFEPRMLFEIFPIGIGSTKAVRQLVGGAQGYRVYDPNGAAVTQMASGGGGTAKGGAYFIDMNENPKITTDARCITARQDSGISNHKGEHSGVFIEDSLHFIDLNEDPKITENARCLHTRMDLEVVGKHKGERSGVLIDENGTYPCLTPTREKIRQNGPRIRGDGEPSFVITATDQNGVIHKGKVRRLCPQEVFRLMGFSNEQFFKVLKVVKSDAKLFKLGGNSIIVPVIVDLGQKLKNLCEKYNVIGN